MKRVLKLDFTDLGKLTVICMLSGGVVEIKTTHKLEIIHLN